MRKKMKYVVSFVDSSTECVLSRVVSSRSGLEAVVSVAMTVLLSTCTDVFLRLKDCEFTVSVSPYVDA